MERARRTPRLILGFGVGSFVAFVLIGLGMGAVLIRSARIEAERRGTFHAEFVATAVLGPALEGIDLTRPVAGEDLERLDAFVMSRVLANGRDVRIKIWSFDGTIVYSDERSLIGQRFPAEAVEFEEVLEHGPDSGVSDLEHAENVAERTLADKLFYTYVPQRLRPGGPVVAVSELYQDYAILQGDIDQLLVLLVGTLGIGLLLLWTVLMPLARRTSRDLRSKNERLNDLLEREQHTVAELIEANRRKDDFVAAASHELRTPLTSIMGYLSTLRQEHVVADERIRNEFIDSAEAQARRLHRLITNLLAAAQLSEGGRPILLEQVDIGQAVHELVDGLPGAPMRIRLVVEPGAGRVVTDRGRLVEILANLIDNALKYSSDDSEVEIGSTLVPEGWRCWVADHGVGIDPADREAIFERFHQLDQTSTRRFGGVGLGLHLVRGMVEELRGRIEVSGAPGEGSTFAVTLPFVPLDAADGVAEAS
jgi:signal transduction histidine kinase